MPCACSARGVCLSLVPTTPLPCPRWRRLRRVKLGVQVLRVCRDELRNALEAVNREGAAKAKPHVVAEAGGALRVPPDKATACASRRTGWVGQKEYADSASMQ